ncbi:MAG: hypothetical protein ABIO44_08810 [Saprospiraceae bacterium]
MNTKNSRILSYIFFALILGYFAYYQIAPFWSYPIFLLAIILINELKFLLYKHYKKITITKEGIYFDHKIHIPLTAINHCCIHYEEDNYESSWIYIIDQYGRQGRFRFHSTKEEFDAIEDQLNGFQINNIRIYNDINNISSSYELNV